MKLNLQATCQLGKVWVLLSLALMHWAGRGHSQLADTFNPGANGSVWALAVQTDGSILVGGAFSTVGGLTRSNLARVKATGSIDTSFNPVANGAVYALAMQADGKIIVGGAFTMLGGQTRNYIARLNSNGSLDTTFNPGAAGPFNPYVTCLALQADGKILVGGRFATLGGQSLYCVGRLEVDGSLDLGFVPPTSVGFDIQSGVNSLTVQPDGTILVCGSFVNIGVQKNVMVRRLNSDGSQSANLCWAPWPTGASSYVASSVLQADGRVCLGGYFSSVNGQFFQNLARLGADGSLESPPVSGASYKVYSLGVQTDGKILVGGSFTTLAGGTRQSIGRLNEDFTLDTTFNPGASNSVLALAIQADGKILAGGGFTNIGSRARSSIARLSNTAAATQSLTYDGANITWLRGDTGPEVWRTTFDAATDGGDWFRLPEGTRIGGGWMPFGWSLPPDPNVVNIRARGYVTGASGNGSAWFVETIIGPPLLTSQPASRTNNAGTTATFSVTAVGSAPFSYQWRKGDALLGNGGNVSGALTATLTLSNVLTADVAGYSVVVSNSYSSLTSQVATLTVVGDPSVNIQPANLTTNAGQTAKFGVTVAGTGPIGFQWRRGAVDLADGGNLYGTRTASLTVSNALRTDAGGYSVVVTNAYGSATSSVATLTILGDLFFITQPTNKTANLGETVGFSATVGGTAPANYQWQRGGTNLPGATTASLILTNVQQGDAGSYTLVASNSFGSVLSAAAVLSVNLAVCDAFNPGANGRIRGLALQPDGRIVVGGDFDYFGGQTRKHIARVYPNGTLDTNFTTSADYGPGGITLVQALATQGDGKVLIGGSFFFYQNYQYGLVRVDAAGVVDTGFLPGVNGFYQQYPYVGGLAFQTNQQLLLAGWFDQLNTQWHTNIARLDATGAADSSFNPATAEAIAGEVYSMAVQPDNRIVVAGRFTSISGQARSRIGRLNADGSLDASFNPGANSNVFCLTIQADGKILVGGRFTTLGGATRNRIARLNANGTLDTGFNPGADNSVSSLAVQADGKILVGGAFTNLAGRALNRIGRLNADGSADPNFLPDADGNVGSLALQADGKILVGGDFQNLAGQPRSFFGRLNATEPATQDLSRNVATLTWLRGGTSPEVWRTSFEASTNGADWVALGDGTRISGGWQLADVTVPNNATIRARGFVTGGYFNGSTWFVESTLTGGTQNPPAILVNDGSFDVRSNRFGFNLKALPGQAVVVEASTNFVSWKPIHTNLMGNLGVFWFSDAQFGLYPRRFYRARLHPDPLPLPAIGSSGGGIRVSNGQFGFNIGGVAGQVVVIEVSSNLSNWQPLQTNTLENGAWFFTDPSGTNFPQRFYRLRLQ